LYNKYKAFGLVIDSPMHLPEAAEADKDATPDVVVTMGVVGEGLPKDNRFDESREKKLWWQAMPNESSTLFNCSEGLFAIKDGREIVIQLYPEADPEKVKIYLLGSAMGAIQTQRGRIPLHGGGVVTDRGAMVVTGGQGAGKSTMTSAFVHQGYRYLTDDVSSVGIEDGQAMVFPAYPQRKLVRDALAPLGYDLESVRIVDSDRDKFAVRDQDNWQRTPVRLAHIIELIPAEFGETVSVAPVTGKDKLGAVLKNLYRFWMHTPTGGIEPFTFKKIVTIAAQAEIYQVRVPRDIENIAGIAQDIADALQIST